MNRKKNARRLFSLIFETLSCTAESEELKRNPSEVSAGANPLPSLAESGADGRSCNSLRFYFINIYSLDSEARRWTAAGLQVGSAVQGSCGRRTGGADAGAEGPGPRGRWLAAHLSSESSHWFIFGIQGCYWWQAGRARSGQVLPLGNGPLAVSLLARVLRHHSVCVALLGLTVLLSLGTGVSRSGLRQSGRLLAFRGTVLESGKGGERGAPHSSAPGDQEEFEEVPDAPLVLV